MTRWQTKEGLVDLLAALVEYQSITGSADEVAIAEYVSLQLGGLSYFKENPDHLRLHPLEDGRQFLTALVKTSPSPETVILLSHFDVVQVEDYGNWKNLAFRTVDLTNEFYKQIDEMPEAVQLDMREGQWLFGRGTMDMKAGLALHMAMIEKAAAGELPGNILLLTVPDEEANSAGMIQAVPALVDLAEQQGLTYKTCLNSEPMFSKYPGDRTKYVYTGSIGKVLPGFFCYGKETHVGEPYSGLNANLMVSEVTRMVELNPDFCEFVAGEMTPPPTNLMQKDLKEGYSVQIPHAAVTTFNVMTMRKTADEITKGLMDAAKQAAHNIETHYMNSAKAFSSSKFYSPKPITVQVLTYEELLKKAIELYGKEEIERRQNYLLANRADLGDRDFTTVLVHDLAALCKQEAPMIILFYSPPFYPAISSAEDEVIQELLPSLKKYSEETHSIDFVEQHYFPGLSDLSFLGLKDTAESLRTLTGNMPIYQNGYELPLKELQQLNVPVFNLGPLGRDAHQWTERLEINYSFEVLEDLLSYTINELLKK